MPHSRGIGREAEDLAAEYLLAKGYTIVTRRHQIRGGELDLVAMDGDVVVFVEVKLRRSADASPEESLTPAKGEHLRRSASRYLDEMDLQGRCSRFDLIAIDQGGLRHLENIFSD